MSRKKCWSKGVGVKPHRVTVYERKPGGPLYIRVWNPRLRGGQGNWVRRSLGHRDKALALVVAAQQYAKLRSGADDLLAGRVTLARLFAQYEEHRTPRKTVGQQKEDKRRVQLWTRFLGGEKDPHKISLGEWEKFIDLRSVGAIDSRGNAVAEKKRRTVRTRTVEADLQWLRWVLNWGSKWRNREGRYLLRENPVRGYEIPTEKNPQRPVATEARFEAVRAVSDKVVMEIRWDGRHRKQRAYLSEILDIANGTGRRLSAIIQLRYEDLLLERTQTAPHGAIRWPADTDKTGRETIVPISPQVRAALKRVLAERPGIGSRHLFPSPVDPDRPVARHRAHKWLRKAEELACVEPLEGSLWHAYRRKWATERKHLPDVDVAAAGGWAGPQTMRHVYQQSDPETMLRVVLEGGELREARG